MPILEHARSTFTKRFRIKQMANIINPKANPIIPRPATHHLMSDMAIELLNRLGVAVSQDSPPPGPLLVQEEGSETVKVLIRSFGSPSPTASLWITFDNIDWSHLRDPSRRCDTHGGEDALVW
jgi:hypothetical protein